MQNFCKVFFYAGKVFALFCARFYRYLIQNFKKNPEVRAEEGNVGSSQKKTNSKLGYRQNLTHWKPLRINKKKWEPH